MPVAAAVPYMHCKKPFPRKPPERQATNAVATVPMEAASVGHKAMWRLSPDQAQRVKARLRELRALVAGQRPVG